MTRDRSGSRRPPLGTPDRPKNRLFSRLSPAEFRRVQPHLTPIPVSARRTFHKRGEPLREVFFLNGGVGSVTVSMADGSSVEVATVGDEGLIGISAIFGDHLVFGETMMQVPDAADAVAMPVGPFRDEMKQRGALHESVSRYSEGFVALLMQSTACVARHQLQERCCRWLLMAHDRVRRDEFDLNHEFLAMMLGSTRPTVSVIAGALQQAGLISYVHGHMTILNRAGLEAGACECYATVKANFDRLGL
jgi:CRP-like cAMP-binding protein